jgi:hypothetical protein
MIGRYSDGSIFNYNGIAYPIRYENSGYEHRVCTFIKVNGKEYCAAPCCLWTSGERWEQELKQTIDKYEISPVPKG